MQEDDTHSIHTPDGGTEDSPEVYAVHKTLGRWHFSRRDFLAAAAASTAAILPGCGSPSQSAQKPAGKFLGAVSPTPTEVMVLQKVSPAAPTAAPTSASPAAAAAEPAPTDTPSPAPTRTPAPTATPEPTATATPGTPAAKFVEDVTIPDDTIVDAGFQFTKTWRIRNSGDVDWGEGVTLSFKEGDSMQATSPAAVDDTRPGDTIDISVDMTAPSEPGRYAGKWTLETGSGAHLIDVWVAILVPSTEPLPEDQEGIEFEAVSLDGVTRRYTLPCGSEIPPSAVCVCNCIGAVAPGVEGTVEPGQEGINLAGPKGEERTMPCGSPIPDGWTCTCDCVTAPEACACVGNCECDAVAGTTCTCDTVATQTCSCDSVHYWYPN